MELQVAEGTWMARIRSMRHHRKHTSYGIVIYNTSLLCSTLFRLPHLLVLLVHRVVQLGRIVAVRVLEENSC